MSNMAKTAAYVRVSTEQQALEKSHVRQKQQITEWADRQSDNHEEIDFYEDIAKSGQSSDRDSYNEMMDNLHKYDTLVVRELSRLGRDVKTILDDIETMKGYSVEFVSIKEDIDTESAMGKALLNIIAAINQLHADLARERSIEMIERRRANNEPIGRPPKLDKEMIEQAREWKDLGHSYSVVKVLLKERYNVDVCRSTVYRSLKREEEE